jgi:hypothetical protein
VSHLRKQLAEKPVKFATAQASPNDRTMLVTAAA